MWIWEELCTKEERAYSERAWSERALCTLLDERNDERKSKDMSAGCLSVKRIYILERICGIS